jgi:hypothetical protein
VLDKLENKTKTQSLPLTSSIGSIPTFSTGPGFSGVGGFFSVGFSTTTPYIASFGSVEDLLDEGVNFWRTVRLRSFVLCWSRSGTNDSFFFFFLFQF